MNLCLPRSCKHPWKNHLERGGTEEKSQQKGNGTYILLEGLTMLVQSLLSFFQLGLQNGITFDLRRKIQQIIEVKKELMKLHVLTSRGVIF
jgi:hypothetical protein